MDILGHTGCHKDIPMISSTISARERFNVESIIEDYLNKRNMNKSNCSRILSESIKGAARGALGGGLVGGGFEGVMSGALVFGSMSGVMKAYSLAYDEDQYLLVGKHT